MGKSSRQKRLEFLNRHPLCCFCGGDVPAVEMDHIPARYLFSERQWPEGYVFPACSACNDHSAADELVMGFIVRIQLSQVSQQYERELNRAIWQVGDRHAKLFKGMKELSRVETKRLLREEGISLHSLPPEPYVVTFPDELRAVVDRYGTKLGKALYYLHTGRIIPKSGGISVQSMTNTQFMSSKFPLEKFQILNCKPILARSGKSLEDQFSYRYTLLEDGLAAAFLVQFRESTAMLLVAYENQTEYEAAHARRSR